MKNQLKNISEMAYLRVKEFLLNSDIYPGQKISHLELGRRLGISFTPLREGFVRLSAEGLLTHQNQKGFSVPEISLNEAKELYEVRALIEPYMVEKAAKSISHHHVRVLSGILKEYKQLVLEPYTRKRLLIDKKFHMEIAKLAGNQRLAQILDRIYDQIIIKRQILNLPLYRGQQAYQEHLQIYKALKMKDGKKSSQLMEDHIRKGGNFVIADIERRQNLESINILSAIKSR